MRELTLTAVPCSLWLLFRRIWILVSVELELEIDFGLTLAKSETR